MFIKENIPPLLWDLAEDLNRQEREFNAEVVTIQKSCKHEWKKVMIYDPDYSPRVDNHGKGQEVIKEFHCILCNLHKTFEGSPSVVCYKCGGTMSFDRREHFGEVRISCYKCKDCGHEYDTT